MVEVGEEGGGVKESEERAAKDCGFGLMVRVDEEKDGRVGVVGGVDSGVTVSLSIHNSKDSSRELIVARVWEENRAVSGPLRGHALPL